MAPPRSQTRFNARMLPGAHPAEYPGFIPPMLATLRGLAPTGDRWLHEIKFDGYRAQAHLVKGKPVIYTRRGHDWTHRFGTVAEATGKLPANHAIIDGEIISAEEDGRPNFSALQDDLSTGRTDRMVYYAFDLLFLDGFDIRAAPLEERKRILKAFLEEAGPSCIIYSEHFDVDGPKIFAQSCKSGLEGIISKMADAAYHSGRRTEWLKIKCVSEDTYTIVGFVPETGSIAALHLAKKKGKQLVYVGKAGTGFTRKVARDLRKKLDALVTPISPLTKKIKAPKSLWVRPELKAHIEFRDITNDGYLRHASFKGCTPKGSREAPACYN